MKSGFVNIIGNPNVGKSTLMNALVGERLSIITSKAQTIRKRVMGIVNGDDFQMIYTDTPGIVNPANKLHEQSYFKIKTFFDETRTVRPATFDDLSDNSIMRTPFAGPAIRPRRFILA